MAETTRIEWADSTFNCWVGCSKVSPGCDNCYAEARMDKRLHVVQWGPGAPRKRTSVKNWHEPVKWNAKPFFQCAACGRRGTRAELEAVNDAECTCRLHAQPARRRVFCASLADVFDNEVPVAWRADLFRLIADTPNLDWLLLTKRIGNAKTMMADALHLVRDANRDGMIWPLPNVWLGATIVNQEEADRDIPKLLATPARVRFLSMEPLLGLVRLDRHLWACCGNFDTGGEYMGQREEVCCGQREPRDMLNWVIVGAESGHGARPVQLDWVRSVVEQCRSAEVACHVKQLGQQVLDYGMSSPGQHWPLGTDRRTGELRISEFDPGFRVHLKHRKGADRSEWPEDLRVRAFPEVA